MEETLSSPVKCDCGCGKEVLRIDLNAQPEEIETSLVFYDWAHLQRFLREKAEVVLVRRLTRG